MSTTTQNPNCCGNHCTLEDGEVRMLPTGGGSSLTVCHACFDYEMAARRERNKELGQSAQFGLPLWLELAVYEQE